MAKELLAPSSIILGTAAAVPLGQGRCFVVGGDQIAVFRQRDGRIFATPNRCPHRQGPLSEGMLGDGRVICPMHAHQFNLETGAGSETTECIQPIPVEIVDGNLLLHSEAVAC